LDKQSIGRVGIWSWLDNYSYSEAVQFAQKAERQGYGAIWIPEAVGRDPFVTLSVLAVETSRINLATGIANIYARDAMAMTAKRFVELAEAFGGDIRRWPVETRGPAFAWLEAHPEQRQVLLDAAMLDAVLNASAPALGSGVLREKFLASAPRARPAVRRASAWVSGAGLAAACVAGVMLGAQISPALIPDAGIDVISDTASAFDGGSWFDGLEAEG